MKIRNNIDLLATPKEGSHLTNKDYVDSKQKTISWADYQALSEGEKCNGTLYNIPDMPIAGQGGIITTYTALEQLGLNAGASVAEIVSAMPDCSYAEIGCYNSTNSYGLEVVTGLPNGEANFILTVRKYNYHRVDIQAKTSASGAVMNDLYIGGMVAGGVEVSWRKVCTTSVEDVATTDLSLTSSSHITSDSSNYVVINGTCYVKFRFVISTTPTSSPTFSAILPKPLQGRIVENALTQETKKDVIIDIQSDGTLILHVEGNGYIGKAISYPVAELRR